MKIEIHFFDIDTQSFIHMADFDTSDIPGSKNELMEGAYAAAQNIFGSWSRGPTIPFGSEPSTVRNEDYNPRITVVRPLEIYDGVEYGHRSMMVGDRLIVDGNTWEVDFFGFKEVE